MGVLYVVWPVDSQIREWLGSQGIDAPPTDSRWPSKQEVSEVLSGLRGFQTRVTDNGPGARWDAFVDCPTVEDLWTLLHAQPKDGADKETEISFEKGHPALVVALLRNIARSTGPLVLIADSGDDPLIIDATVPYGELAAHFYDVDEESPACRQLLHDAAGGPDPAS